MAGRRVYPHIGVTPASQTWGRGRSSRAVLTMITASGLLGDELTDVTGYRHRFSVWRQLDTPRDPGSDEHRLPVVFAGARLIIGTEG